ncbi:extracellular solute-binding protein [Microlunatus speluncae]|uniref:extracellular solute-binding protein n=1 Tax=Microlunatus speluncae TaxID=2594267 RepID=UPI00126678F1|nr:extracellular solute-binding protein [Microlunatus speluncae]
MDRRGFLAGATLAAAGLAGCTDQTGPVRQERGSGELPTRVPFAAGEPDLPEAAGGVPAGYFSYPAEPQPRKGFPYREASAPITTLLQGTAAVAPKERNPWWQRIERESGFSFALNPVQSADYQAKFQVTLAGGEVPDLVQIVGVPGLPNVLDKYFTDLTDFLAGDAIAEYPGLAAIPTETWKIGQVNGRLWGIAQPRPPAGRICSYRGDLFARHGITAAPELRDGQDFLDLCRQLSDPGRAVFALGANLAGWILPAMLEMVGAPNDWALEGETFTHAYETEQMKQALDLTLQLFRKQYVHPDSPSAGAENYTWWQGGQTSLYLQSFSGWGTYARVNPDWRLGALTLPKWDGGGPAAKHLSVAGYTAFVAIKKASDERVREILRFADFVASPFGSSGELLINYGVEGTHYTLTGSDPIATAAAKTDLPTGLNYLGGQSSAVIYTPGDREIVQQQYDYLKAVLPTGVKNPTEGLFSDTSSTSGSSARRAINDLQTQIVIGRKPLSEWDAAVDRWRRETGDQQRRDYQEALQRR